MSHLDNAQTEKIFTLEKEHESLLPLIEEAFKREAIQLQIRSRYDTAYDGIFVDQKGLAEICVFPKDKERALKILRDILEDVSE